MNHNYFTPITNYYSSSSDKTISTNQEGENPTLPIQQINDVKAFQERVQILLEKHLTEKSKGVFF